MNNRKAFEAEVNRIGILTSFDRNDNGTYKFALMQYLSAIWQAALASQAQQTESQWIIPTESQILAATEKAGLWPNTVYTWLPAFRRYHAELAKLPPAPEGDKQ